MQWQKALEAETNSKLHAVYRYIVLGATYSYISICLLPHLLKLRQETAEGHENMRKQMAAKNNNEYQGKMHEEQQWNLKMLQKDILLVQV